MRLLWTVLIEKGKKDNSLKRCATFVYAALYKKNAVTPNNFLIGRYGVIITQAVLRFSCRLF